MTGTPVTVYPHLTETVIHAGCNFLGIAGLRGPAKVGRTARRPYGHWQRCQFRAAGNRWFLGIQRKGRYGANLFAMKGKGSQFGIIALLVIQGKVPRAATGRDTGSLRHIEIFARTFRVDFDRVVDLIACTAKECAVAFEPAILFHVATSADSVKGNCRSRADRLGRDHVFVHKNPRSKKITKADRHGWCPN